MLTTVEIGAVVLTGAIGWERHGRAAALILRHVGGQFEHDLNQNRLPSATTLDAFLAWPVSKRLDVIVRAQNLADDQVVAGIDDDGTVERSTPRTLWLGLRFGSR